MRLLRFPPSPEALPPGAGNRAPASARHGLAVSGVRTPLRHGTRPTRCAAVPGQRKQRRVSADTLEGLEEELTEGQLCLMTGEPDACGYIARPVGHADLEACEQLLRSVHFDTSTQDWSMIMRYRKDDVYGVFHRDCMVGLVSAVPYASCEQVASAAAGRFGWLGNVVVHPDYRRKGLAHMLLSYGIRFLKARHNCECVLLDASSMGKPVYSKLGFKDCALVHRMRIVDAGAAEAWAHIGARGQDASTECFTIEPLQPEAIPDVLTLDAEVFGGDRSLLLEEWMGHIPGTSFQARDADGRLQGYSLSHSREVCTVDLPWSHMLLLLNPARRSHRVWTLCS